MIKMDIKDFASGTYKEQFQYKSFLPNPVNRDWSVTDEKLINGSNIFLKE